MTRYVCRPLALKPHDYPGTLITFCGVDGSGKSSLIASFEQACRATGLGCVRTFTPTRRIREDAVFRKLVAEPDSARIDVLGVLLSIMGDLVQHTTDTIIPALARGDVVLCDRYVFTSQAEIAARSDLRVTEPVLQSIAEHVLEPDLAFGLCVSSETSYRRVLARNQASDQPPPRAFLERQVAAYRAVFQANALVMLDSERDLHETCTRALNHFAAIEARAFPARPPITLLETGALS